MLATVLFAMVIGFDAMTLTTALALGYEGEPNRSDRLVRTGYATAMLALLSALALGIAAGVGA